jgi:hypothetical protein
VDNILVDVPVGGVQVIHSSRMHLLNGGDAHGGLQHELQELPRIRPKGYRLAERAAIAHATNDGGSMKSSIVRQSDTKRCRL